MTDLAAMHCEPCKAGTPPIAGAERRQLLEQLSGWSLAGVDSGVAPAAGGPGAASAAGARLEKEYRFADFQQALDFVNRVGAVAEHEGHHPDVELGWGRVKLILWTHSIGGLSMGDFILAAKADRALTPLATAG